MLKEDLMQGSLIELNDPSIDYYLIKDAKLNEDTNWDKDDYKRYLKETYNINVNVQDFKVYSYSAYIQMGNMGSGYGNSMVIFKTKGKWFFGGVVSRGLNDPYQLIPADTKYSGEIIE